jgi:tRNA-specific 2-thiouridylase
MLNKGNKVAVALSGGVDSSQCAALLKRAGFKIGGFFLNLYSSDFFRESLLNAKRTAEKLEIPFFEIDARKEFKKEVIDYFLSELKKGRTPNPCVVCNEKIKADFLIKKIKDFDFLATGHYVKKEGKKLFIAEDKSRDQSYFLWKISPKNLSKIIFPLGELKKKNISKEDFLERRESREICFIKDNLENFAPELLRKGVIKNKEGKVLGYHKGLPFYTIGQRKGLDLPDGPYYVLEKELKENCLIVSKDKKDLLKEGLTCSSLNWISGKEPSFPLKVMMKTRYNQNLFSVVLKKEKNEVRAVFNKKQEVSAPGQSAVFYSLFRKDLEMIGGGIIENIF